MCTSSSLAARNTSVLDVERFMPAMRSDKCEIAVDALICSAEEGEEEEDCKFDRPA